MSNEQPNVVGAGTSVNKEYCKSKEASDSSCILLERDPCLRRATNSCNRSRASQTEGYSVFSVFLIEVRMRTGGYFNVLQPHIRQVGDQWRTQDFFQGGSTNSVEDRENGDLGALPPNQGFWRQL